MEYEKVKEEDYYAIFTYYIKSGCSDSLSLSDKQLREDLVGKSINLKDGTSVKLNKNILKSATVEDTQVEQDQGKVLADIQVEILEEEAGNKNRQERQNHLNHMYSGNIVVNYTNYDKEWKIESISTPDRLAYSSKEVDNLIEPVPAFNKEHNEILNDLKTDYLGPIRLNDGGAVFTSFSPSITFNNNEEKEELNGYTLISRLNNFEVLKVKEGNNQLQKAVDVTADFDFNVDMSFDIYEESGLYNAKGLFTIIYQLIEKKNGKLIWEIVATETEKDDFVIMKK